MCMDEATKTKDSCSRQLCEIVGFIEEHLYSTCSRNSFKGSGGLLSQIVDIYWVCLGLTPNQEKLPIEAYVAYVAQCVGGAIRETEKRYAVHNAATRNSPVGPITFSENSIQRQLCNLAPRAGPEELMQGHREWFIYLWNQAYQSLASKPSVDYIEVHDLGDYKQGIVATHPLGSSSPCEASSPLMFSPAPERPKTYFDGRDNWGCDFCGPLSFCDDLDD